MSGASSLRALMSQVCACSGNARETAQQPCLERPTALEYVQDILEFSRTAGHFRVGLSPRAGLNLLTAAKAAALLVGREHVLPEDVQHVLPWVVGHRLRSREDLLEVEQSRLMALLMEVPIP